MSGDAYEGREQSEAKHLILREYLQALALKVGQFSRGTILNYVDGFAGPWEARTDDLSDTSPGIALAELTAARNQLRSSGIAFKARAFFVAKTPDGAAELQGMAQRFPDVEITVAAGSFEDRIDDACRFTQVGKNGFTFVFIDPTGWTGFGLKKITPLLLSGRTEVLINFMTGHINRFIDGGPASSMQSFVDLFGDESYRERWRALSGLDREDRMVETYRDRIAAAGLFEHCGSAVVLNPRADRTHFHLIYASHSQQGLVTFRNIERALMRHQRGTRAEIKLERRVSKTGQAEMFGAADVASRTYEDDLKSRYLRRARQQLDEQIATGSVASWDALVMQALRIPLVHDSDVKAWLRDRVAEEAVVVGGLAKGSRVPQLKKGHTVQRRA